MIDKFSKGWSDHLSVAVASEKILRTPAHEGNERTQVWFLSVKVTMIIYSFAPVWVEAEHLMIPQL